MPKFAIVLCSTDLRYHHGTFEADDEAAARAAALERYQNDPTWEVSDTEVTDVEILECDLEGPSTPTDSEWANRWQLVQ